MDCMKVAEDVGCEIVQFSVLLDNSVGSVLRILKLLQANGISVLAMNLADNSDTSVLRFVANYSEEVIKCLDKNKINFIKQNVICVEIQSIDKVNNILQAFFEAEVLLHYFYTFLCVSQGNVGIVISAENFQLGSQILRKSGIKMLSSSDISR